MVVVQNERLKQRDQLALLSKLARAAGERRAKEPKRPYAAVDGPNDEFLRGGRKSVIAGLRHRDGVELQAQPVMKAVLRTIELPVTEARHFDRAAHVARISDRGG